ncbi:hypothetical protein ABN028_15085 [Actinopolymorpha sp. B17G11]|uniref:hypothetical protein n=1 Tax=Actinopolymorpha sp. B17G11 TaxID=3160861 RepID=UPI0032E499A6
MVHPSHQPHGPGQQQPGGQQPGGHRHPGFQTGQDGHGHAGGPSQRKRTGAVVAVVASVVGLLAGLGVAGFVEPGFFLSDGKAPVVGGAADPTTTPKENVQHSASGSDGPSAGSDLPTPHDGAEGQALIRTFLDKTNAGDAAGAMRLLCADSDSQVELASAIQGKANLEINTVGQVLSKPDFAAADLKGTVNGEPVSVGRVSAFYQDGGWCVFTFYTA